MANLPSFGSIKTSLGNLCLPSQIYLVLSVFALLFAAFNSFSIITIIVKIIFIGLWTFILNWICQKGYETISWALVVLPYVLLVLMFLFGMEIADKKAVKSTDHNGQQEQKEQPSVQTQPTIIQQQPTVIQQQPTVIQPPQQVVVQKPTYSEAEVFSKENRQYLAY